MRARAFLLEAIVARAARAYLGGADIAGALATCGALAAGGVSAFTLGFWNRAGAGADDVARDVADSAAALAARGIDARVALKAPALGFRDDLVESIAAASSLPLHLDSHGIDAQDATLSLAREGMGATLPGRWLRSALDARVLAVHGVGARVVKGQFPADAGDECDAREGFLRVVRALAGAPRVSVATHDPALARLALESLLERRTRCELELLYGLPQRPSRDVAESLGVPVRVYVPWGTAYLPYALGSLKREPWRVALLARDLVRGL